jgi:hypothetical protein
MRGGCQVEREKPNVDARELRELTEILTRVAESARQDAETAEQVRDAIVESGLLDVFGISGALDVVELLDVGGEETLRARLERLALADLREIVKAQQLDPEKTTVRWRSTAKLIDFIFAQASQRLAQEQEADVSQPSALVASWML